MKATLFIISLLLASSLCQSQGLDDDKRSNSIGVTYSSFGNNDVIQFQSLEGGRSYEGGKFFSLGLNYIHPLNHWLDFETGIEYSKHSIIVGLDLSPSAGGTPIKNSLLIINVPIAVKANFFKYFFLNTGLLIDIDASKESVISQQNGIGGFLGLGANYDFDFGVSVFVNPYFKVHSLLQFSGESYAQRLLESGIRVGVTYKLHRKG